MEADKWAVDLVVNEHVKMNLNEAERVLAAVRLRDEHGVLAPEIADILRCTCLYITIRRWPAP